jgi:hypothetical protein
VRLLELVAIVAFLGGGAAIGRVMWRAVAAPRAADDWEPFHRYEDDCRKVYVRRGDELEPVGEVAPADADYDAVFMRLMDRARERAAVLNSER